MKVAIVHNTYRQPGGEDAVVAEETRLLESHGHKVVSYRRGNHELDGMSKPKLLLQVKDIVHSTSSKNDVRELIRAEKPDIVHIHNTFLMISPSAYEACEEEGVPVVQTLHNFRLFCPGGTFEQGRIRMRRMHRWEFLERHSPRLLPRFICHDFRGSSDA